MIHIEHKEVLIMFSKLPVYLLHCCLSSTIPAFNMTDIHINKLEKHSESAYLRQAAHFNPYCDFHPIFEYKSCTKALHQKPQLMLSS